MKLSKWVLTMVLLAGFTAGTLPLHAAQDMTEDSVVDKVSDWFATMGKSQEEKDQILMERKADRAAKRLKKAFKAESKKVEKNMKKMNKEMESMF